MPLVELLVQVPPFRQIGKQVAFVALLEGVVAADQASDPELDEHLQKP